MWDGNCGALTEPATLLKFSPIEKLVQVLLEVSEQDLVKTCSIDRLCGVALDLE